MVIWTSVVDEYTQALLGLTTTKWTSTALVAPGSEYSRTNSLFAISVFQLLAEIVAVQLASLRLLPLGEFLIGETERVAPGSIGSESSLTTTVFEVLRALCLTSAVPVSVPFSVCRALRDEHNEVLRLRGVAIAVAGDHAHHITSRLG